MPRRSRPTRALAAALLPLVVAACVTARPDDPTPALRRLLAPLGIATEELGIRDLDAPVDRWRLAIVDALLAHPLEAVSVVRGVAAELHAQRRSLASLIRAGARLLEVELAAAPAAADDPLGAVETALRPLPAELRAIVLDLLHAMATAAPIVRGAAAGLTDDERAFVVDMLRPGDDAATSLDESAAWRFVELAGRVDRAALLRGAALVAVAVDRALPALSRWRGRAVAAPPVDPAWRWLAEGDVVLVADTPLGPLVVGGPGPTTYRGDAALIIDLGGDDVYEGAAGGARGPERPVAVVIDLGGDDRYEARDDVAQGAGVFGVGILVDVDGDDTYAARGFAQGAGIFGVGMLVDRRGRDRYQATHHAQGAAAFGFGALVDERGHDRYQADIFAQGFGRTAGLGVLLDRRGDDAYTMTAGPPDVRRPDHARTLGQGFGYGFRPLASGGIGLLLDHRGDDRYHGDYFAQGASYWYGLGALIDDAGDDHYAATRYAQGAGIHFSVGVLWDGGGDDDYRAVHVAQGVGHDYGVGILADGGGDDVYAANALAQGAGNIDGLGLLIDVSGDDRYESSGPSVQGYGQDGRRAQTFGFLVDLAGDDHFGRPMSGPLEWSGSGWGGRIDGDGLELGASLAPRPFERGRRTPPTLPAIVLRAPEDPTFAARDGDEARIQRLVIEAVDPVETPAGEAKRNEARRRLDTLGPEAIAPLVRLLESLNVGVVGAAVRTLIRLGPDAHAALLARLDAPGGLARRRAAFVLAQRPTPDSARALWARVGGDADPRLRAAAADALGRACLDEARGLVAGLGGDASVSVRYAGVRALGRLEGPVSLVTPALADPAFQVRLAARRILEALAAGDRGCSAAVPGTPDRPPDSR